MSEWEEAIDNAEGWLDELKLYAGKDELEAWERVIEAGKAEITRLQDLHLDRTKLTTQVIEERDGLKEELAGCKEDCGYLRLQIQAYRDEYGLLVDV